MIHSNNSAESANRLSDILFHNLPVGYVYWNVATNTINQENADVMPAGLTD